MGGNMIFNEEYIQSNFELYRKKATYKYLLSYKKNLGALLNYVRQNHIDFYTGGIEVCLQNVAFDAICLFSINRNFYDLHKNQLKFAEFTGIYNMFTDAYNIDICDDVKKMVEKYIDKSNDQAISLTEQSKEEIEWFGFPKRMQRIFPFERMADVYIFDHGQRKNISLIVNSLEEKNILHMYKNIKRSVKFLIYTEAVRDFIKYMPSDNYFDRMKHIIYFLDVYEQFKNKSDKPK